MRKGRKKKDRFITFALMVVGNVSWISNSGHLDAIEQVAKYHRDVREVAQALEFNPDYLRKWINHVYY